MSWGEMHRHCGRRDNGFFNLEELEKHAEAHWSVTNCWVPTFSRASQTWLQCLKHICRRDSKLSQHLDEVKTIAGLSNR